MKKLESKVFDSMYDYVHKMKKGEAVKVQDILKLDTRHEGLFVGTKDDYVGSSIESYVKRDLIKSLEDGKMVEIEQPFINLSSDTDQRSVHSVYFQVKRQDRSTFLVKV